MNSHEDAHRPRGAPDGIGQREIEPVQDWRRRASPISLLAFGTVVVVALLGILGHERTWDATGDGVNLEVHMPEVIRNGEFFELRVTVDAERDIGDLVVRIDQSLWQDITINTTVPAPAEEASEDGAFTFRFGDLADGSTFLLKVDGQVNPDIVGGNDGAITVLDGEEQLAEVEVSMGVLP
jgi:hypothetical protein